jgi:hypothetical protein
MSDQRKQKPGQQQTRSPVKVASSRAGAHMATACVYFGRSAAAPNAKNATSCGGKLHSTKNWHDPTPVYPPDRTLIELEGGN